MANGDRMSLADMRAIRETQERARANRRKLRMERAEMRSRARIARTDKPKKVKN